MQWYLDFSMWTIFCWLDSKFDRFTPIPWPTRRLVVTAISINSYIHTATLYVSYINTSHFWTFDLSGVGRGFWFNMNKCRCVDLCDNPYQSTNKDTELETNILVYICNLNWWDFSVRDFHDNKFASNFRCNSYASYLAWYFTLLVMNERTCEYIKTDKHDNTKGARHYDDGDFQLCGRRRQFAGRAPM